MKSAAHIVANAHLNLQSQQTTYEFNVCFYSETSGNLPTDSNQQEIADLKVLEGQIKNYCAINNLIHSSTFQSNNSNTDVLANTAGVYPDGMFNFKAGPMLEAQAIDFQSMWEHEIKVPLQVVNYDYALNQLNVDVEDSDISDLGDDEFQVTFH